MKKKILIFSLVAIFGIGIFYVCATGASKEVGLCEYSQYLVCNDTNKTLEGKETVSFFNYTDSILQEVKMHLYPNAFRQGAKAEVVSLANYDKTYPRGESFGGITIESANFKTSSLEFEVGGVDENILTITLPAELYPNDTFEFEIGFSVSLPNAHHRFGWGDNTINLCNYYPILCVYEDGAFVEDLYDSNGDPFYSKVANYLVEIEYPKNLTLASTGEQNTQVYQDKKVSKISAGKVRDFAMVLSAKFQHYYEEYKGTKINYYYYDDLSSVQTIEVIKKVLETNKKFGAYPYRTLSVAEANFVHGGMEYPSLVLIADDLADYETYVNVVVHELCHQWWYGVVGNNQYKYGFLDEGLTDYTTALFYDAYPEYKHSSSEIFENARAGYKNFLKVYGGVYENFTPSMLRSLNEFDTEYEYVYCSYVKGMIMMADLEELMGRAKVEKCLRAYFEEYKFKEATPDDFVLVVCKTSGKNLVSWFDSWFLGRVQM